MEVTPHGPRMGDGVGAEKVQLPLENLQVGRISAVDAFGGPT